MSLSSRSSVALPRRSGPRALRASALLGASVLFGAVLGLVASPLLADETADQPTARLADRLHDQRVAEAVSDPTGSAAAVAVDQPLLPADESPPQEVAIAPPEVVVLSPPAMSDG